MGGMVGGMNIQCKWNAAGDILGVYRCDKLIAVVHGNSDPCLSFREGVIASFTFSEIEHIMDNWENMPKDQGGVLLKEEEGESIGSLP